MMLAKQLIKKPKVIVIEDNDFLQKLHEITLTSFGFDVTVVGHAQQAIELWNEHWDLIFSDIGLPDVDGNELCRKRREYEKQNGIYTPAFAYTAFGDTIKQKCLSSGFDAFGVKPMKKEELQEILQKLLPGFQLNLIKNINKNK